MSELIFKNGYYNPHYYDNVGRYVIEESKYNITPELDLRVFSYFRPFNTDTSFKAVHVPSTVITHYKNKEIIRQAWQWYNEEGTMNFYDRPAMKRISGEYLYGINNKLVPAEEYLEWTEQSGIDIKNITEDDKILIHLRWPR